MYKVKSWDIPKPGMNELNNRLYALSTTGDSGWSADLDQSAAFFVVTLSCMLIWLLDIINDCLDPCLKVSG